MGCSTERGFSSGGESNLASLVRHVVALFEEARQGLESLAYPRAVPISASPSQLSFKSAVLYRGLDRAQTHRELSWHTSYARPKDGLGTGGGNAAECPWLCAQAMEGLLDGTRFFERR
jgi:hypothetical protein